jgi:hypothetical protein
VTLPQEWRLLWVGDSTEVEVVALDSLEVCEGDTASVYEVQGPSTPEDSTANLATARFCSGGSGGASEATYLLDLPAWGRGKCKVVALDPADSTAVLESNEVTFNGGVSDSYPPVVLRVASSHAEAQFFLWAVGTGLAETDSVKLVAPNSSWTVPLNLVQKSNTTLAASAYVAADLPASVLTVTAAPCGVAFASVPAEIPLIPLAPIGSSGLMVPGDSIQPKDFAFIFQSQLNIFHLFYIWSDRKIVLRQGIAQTEKFLGHAWSTDLLHWTQMPPVLAVRDTSWDNFHVWAPSIVQNGATYYLFYTGVSLDTTAAPPKALPIQRIGVATADATTPGDSLKTWTRRDDWIFSHDNVPWAAHDTLRTNGQQFRDPFVMADPESLGHYLMYYVTVPGYDTASYVVGVAKSSGDLTRWRNHGPLHGTDRAAVPYAFIESPHAVPHFIPALNRSQWWLFFSTRPSPGVPDMDVHFEKNSTSFPSDTTALPWGGESPLFDYLGRDSTVSYWHASEYLFAVGHEFMAAFDDFMWAIDINEVGWKFNPPYDFYLTPPWLVSVENFSGPAQASEIRLSLAMWRPGGQDLRLRVDLPSAMRAQLDLFDVLGRRVRTLLDRDVPRGQTTVSWDGRDAGGRALGSGMFFARLSCAGQHRVVRVPLVR